jgi:hypothetical protein
MTRRRSLGLAALVLSAGAILWWWRRAPGAGSVPAPASTFTPIVVPAATPEPWMQPIDGGCPEGFPVKVNTTSGIYHVPGGRFYDRASPQRCYATAEQAEADGYRRAKA